MTRGGAQAITNRRRQRIRLMQAEVDGRGLVEVARVPKQPFIEPASLRPWWGRV
jgi:hypothetical protein